MVDPLHAAIVEALKGNEINPETFERCAVDLLRSEYPGVAQIRGGSDGGADGVIVTAHGHGPIICTTMKSVDANVKKSLASWHSANGTFPPVAVVATSRSVTPKLRAKIEAHCRDVGTRLINIHDATDFADRLYRNASWRKRLLVIAGDLPALSRYAPHSRPRERHGLVGRASDLDWLRARTGDCVLAGQPGVGKTSLHETLAEEGACLFLACDDETRIANALRDQSPSIVVVDDAHLDESALRTLLKIRREIGADFGIHANCWTDSEETVGRILSLDASAHRTIHRLDRDTMVEVINLAGLGGPDSLIHRILNLAEGRPGIATQLVQACFLGKTREAMSGEWLVAAMLDRAELRETDAALTMLAAFAIGGGGGMLKSAVAEATGLRPSEMAQGAARLQAGGLLGVLDADRWSVQPREICAALVKRVCFDRPTMLNPIDLAANAPSIAEAAHVLLFAKRFGAAVPEPDLLDILERANDREIWEHLAHADARGAEYVLANHPEWIEVCADGLLSTLPSRAIPALLSIVHDRRPHISTKLVKESSDSLLTKIRDWTNDITEDSRHAVERRRLVFEAALEWARRANTMDSHTLGAAIAISVAAGYSGARSRPGSGRSYTSYRGVLTVDMLRGLDGIWDRLMGLTSELKGEAWVPILYAAERWANPLESRVQVEHAADSARFLRRRGKDLVASLAHAHPAKRAVAAWMDTLYDGTGVEHRVPVEPLFELLYQPFKLRRLDQGGWQTRRSELSTSLAEEFIRFGPASACDEVRAAIDEGSQLGDLLPGPATHELFNAIAPLVADPLLWIEGIRDASLDSRAVEPFLWRHIDRFSPDRIATLLDDSAINFSVARHTLRRADLTQELIDRAADILAPTLGQNFWILHDRDVPSSAMLHLLQHSDPQVRGAAAVAEWLAESEGVVRPDLIDTWKIAAQNIGHHDSFGGKVLASDPEVAFEWCKCQLLRDDHSLWELDDIFAEIGPVLSSPQRSELLTLITPRNYHRECFDAILDDEFDLFGKWFATCGAAEVRLYPLRREVGERWTALALQALDNGLTRDELADHCGHCLPDGIVCGSMADRIGEIEAKYLDLLKHPDGRLHPTGRRGAETMKRDREMKERSEREELVYGIDRVRS